MYFINPRKTIGTTAITTPTDTHNNERHKKSQHNSLQQFKISKIHAQPKCRLPIKRHVTRHTIKSSDSIALVREVALELHLLFPSDFNPTVVYKMSSY